MVGCNPIIEFTSFDFAQIKLPAVKAPESRSSNSSDSFMTEVTPDDSDTNMPSTRFEPPVCPKRTTDSSIKLLPPSGHDTRNDFSDDDDEHYRGLFSSGSDDTISEPSPRHPISPELAVETNAPPNEFTSSSLEGHLSIYNDDNDMSTEESRHSEVLCDPIWEGSVFLISGNLIRQNCGRVAMRLLCPTMGKSNTNHCFPQLQLTVERFYRFSLVARLIQNVDVSVKTLGSLSEAPENSNHLDILQQYMMRTRMVSSSSYT